MKNIKYIFFILTVCCIGFIWFHSFLNGDDSSEESQMFLGFFQDLFNFLGIPEDMGEFIIRKCAHFLEFSGLGFLLTCDLYLFCKYPIKNIPATLLIGLLTACIDETIQIFSVGRSSKVTDVWVDFSGIVAATVVTVILWQVFFKKYYVSKINNA